MRRIDLGYGWWDIPGSVKDLVRQLWRGTWVIAYFFKYRFWLLRRSSNTTCNFWPKYPQVLKRAILKHLWLICWSSSALIEGCWKRAAVLSSVSSVLIWTPRGYIELLQRSSRRKTYVSYSFGFYCSCLCLLLGSGICQRYCAKAEPHFDHIARVGWLQETAKKSRKQGEFFILFQLWIPFELNFLLARRTGAIHDIVPLMVSQRCLGFLAMSSSASLRTCLKFVTNLRWSGNHRSYACASR